MRIRSSHKFYNFIIYGSIDFVALALSFLLSYKLYFISGIGRHAYYPMAHVISASLAASLPAVAMMAGFGVYNEESGPLNVKELENVLKSVTFVFLLFGTLLFFGKIYISRYVLFFSYIVSMVFLITGKTVLYKCLPSKILKKLHKRILIYGAGELGQTLFQEIVNSPKLYMIPVGFVDDDKQKKDFVCHKTRFDASVCLKVLGSGKDIDCLMREWDIDEVFIAFQNGGGGKIVDLLNAFREKNIAASFVPGMYETFIYRTRINMIGSVPIAREESRRNHFYVTYCKKFIDVFFSLALLILLCPVFWVVALAVKLDSRGPVFFSHDRVGKDGKKFKLYKFRSMRSDSDPYAENPLDTTDPRITRAGRLIRRKSLDELPQLFNVLKGDMSLVGPRPEMPFIAETYNATQKERLKVLPGITGLWQLSGDRKKAIHENLDYDLYYIRNASFFLDAAILIQTVLFGFKGV